ncbi:RraA family protein [Nocardioides sp.]|uniref:RraA family protein n=1 Tax=Nocardioides sp. TaxID=35761 RepID=UPI003D0EDBBE
MTTTNNPVFGGDSPQAALDVDGLLRYGTATLHEAAEVNSVLPPAIRPVVPGVGVCGPAFTVETGAGDNLWIHRALYRAPAGSVLVVSCNGVYEYGYWGEILSTAAKECGLAGVVIDGFVRDSVPLAEVGFPVFARGLCVRGTTKRPGARAGVGMPLNFGGIVVRPGDIIVGDADGVISLPPESYAGLLDRAAERISKEQLIMEQLRRGERSVDLLGLEP